MKKIKVFLPALLMLLFFTSFFGITSVSASEVNPSVSASEVNPSVSAPEVNPSVSAPEVDPSISAPEVNPSVSAPEATYDFSPSALEPDSTYPGTNIRVKVGDVLYSSKALGGSAMIVGHVGIIGPDYMVYHVNAVNDNQGEGGKRDTISYYQTRHKAGESIAVYRATHGRNAAYWAQNNYSSVTSYHIPIYSWDNFQLKTINPNYCSKFIWQAFYYGNYDTDYIIGHYTPNKEAFVTPGQVIDSNDLTYVGSFGSRS
ncbi:MULTISPECIES: hypothetical protein [Paenibacillus]|uniref:hypothetical protein n=1 Tax=Paenibacillus TaxID=44249 RepID=UPI0003D2B511|nr:hypothetical protein [Paenibacillus polymyxa]AHC19328.1 hypothetical protein X809_08880 [Paenibacillus polymyxa CR1]